MKEILNKLKSRKLWAMIAGVVSGLAMVFELDQGVVTDVSGAVLALVSIVSYIVTEGKIDAAGLKAGLEAAQEAMKNENKPEGN